MSAIVFMYAPYFALFGFLGARMYRWGILRNGLVPAAPDVSPVTEAALVLGFATLLVAHLTTAVAPGAMRALLSDPDRVAVMETIGLIGALLFAWGVAARLRRRVAALRAGVPRQRGPVAVLALLLALCLSGVYLTISYRWMSVWYAYIFAPYARSIVVAEPAIGAVVASPWAIQQHALLLMALVAVWPAAGLPFDEIFPLRAVARRFGQVGASAPVTTIGLLLLALGATGCPGKLGNQQGHAPAQPIAFSHAIHAGLYELDCQYCHAGAERSRHAGVPAASVCLNCHSQVKTDSPEIQKLTAFVRNDQPVPWEKVHRLPDFAFFNHASHVTAGLACQTCHGPVQQMVRVEQQETMTMGWCLGCHRGVRDEQRDAPLPLATLAMGQLDNAAKVPPRHLQPPTDCSACHR